MMKYQIFGQNHILKSTVLLPETLATVTGATQQTKVVLRLQFHLSGRRRGRCGGFDNEG